MSKDFHELFNSFLKKRKPVQIETLTLEDDTMPAGTEARYADEEPDIKDGDDLTLPDQKVIGGEEDRPEPTYIEPKEVIDNRTPGAADEYVFVYNKAKKVYVKRKKH